MKLPRAEPHKVALAASTAVLIPMALYPAVFHWGLFIGVLSLAALLSDGRAPRWASRALIVPSLVASSVVFAATGLALLGAFGLSPAAALSAPFLLLSLVCFLSLIKYFQR